MNNRTLLLVVVVIAALTNASAYVFDLYDRLFWVDKALHFYTSFAVTLALAFLWRAQLVQPLRAHPLVLVLALASLGLALGVAWEIGEWMADVFSSQNVIKGKTDTIVDLILDGAGAAVAGWVALPRGRNSPEARESLREAHSRGIAMKREPKNPRRQRQPGPGGAGVCAKEDTGHIPTGPGPNPSADKAKKESGQGPTRGVGEKKERE